MALITRRAALVGGLTGAGLAGAGLTAGCSRVLPVDKLTQDGHVQHILANAQGWDHHSQRWLQGGGSLAREFRPADISAHFKPNGTLHPAGDAYARSLAAGFADWRLRIDGMVARPMTLSVAQLRLLPARTQITRHDCVEGWSAIGGWTGVQLGLLLRSAGLLPGARFVVFHCADNLGGEPAKGGAQSPGQYYESLGLDDAFHPQTLIGYAMNGRPLQVPYGAPLRLRVERQLGYKQAKYVQGIEVVDRLDHIAGGQGGYWEDRGYEWYAGV